MYRSVLVPLDGSPFAEKALPYALNIARRAGARLQFVMVGPHPADTQRNYLEHIVERLGRQDGVPAVPATCHLLEGESVAQTICAHVERNGVDVVIMTTHGRGTFGHLLLGSVAYEVMHRLPVPLLLIRPGAGAPEWGVEPDLNHMLIILDGSATAERILDPAVAFGKLLDVDYTLLRVISIIPIGAPELDSVSLSAATPELLREIRAVRARVRKQAEDYLDGVAERFRAGGLRVQTHVTGAYDPESAILGEVAAPGVDLVALETHGHHRSELFHGTLARKVVHGTSKPVFVFSGAAVDNGARARPAVHR